uniref:Uncharacterized protein n=1 Tax=Oryza rufipogon TaxID=4529 RepID=A0A0E0Q697_ORYRU
MSLMKSCKCVYLICLNSPLKERDASHKDFICLDAPLKDEHVTYKDIGGTGSQAGLGFKLPLVCLLET